MDPNHVDADPDPFLHFDADPEDPDPAPHQSEASMPPF